MCQFPVRTGKVSSYVEITTLRLAAALETLTSSWPGSVPAIHAFVNASPRMRMTSACPLE